MACANGGVLVDVIGLRGMAVGTVRRGLYGIGGGIAVFQWAVMAVLVDLLEADALVVFNAVPTK
jgi:hypothetical protein